MHRPCHRFHRTHCLRKHCLPKRCPPCRRLRRTHCRPRHRCHRCRRSSHRHLHRHHRCHRRRPSRTRPGSDCRRDHCNHRARPPPAAGATSPASRVSPADGPASSSPVPSPSSSVRFPRRPRCPARRCAVKRALTNGSPARGRWPSRPPRKSPVAERPCAPARTICSRHAHETSPPATSAQLLSPRRRANRTRRGARFPEQSPNALHCRRTATDRPVPRAQTRPPELSNVRLGGR